MDISNQKVGTLLTVLLTNTKLKISTEYTKRVKFNIPGFTGFKAGIFLIRYNNLLSSRSMLFTYIQSTTTKLFRFHKEQNTKVVPFFQIRLA